MFAQRTQAMDGRTGTGAPIHVTLCALSSTLSDPSLIHSTPHSPPTSKHIGTHPFLTSNHFSGFSSDGALERPSLSIPFTLPAALGGELPIRSTYYCSLIVFPIVYEFHEVRYHASLAHCKS